MGLPIDGGPDDGNVKHDGESDSEIENFGSKDKGSRNKINRVRLHSNIRLLSFDWNQTNYREILSKKLLRY